MTQQRHIEAAEKIVEDLIVNGGFVLQRYKSAKIIALALAEAENRAAWDGREFGSRETGHHLCGSPAECAEVYREFVAKYGPRPTKENQP